MPTCPPPNAAQVLDNDPAQPHPPAVSGSPPPRLPAPPFGLLEGAALFLDFDGTLVPLAETPDAVRVDIGLHQLLGALSELLDGRVAIVSGRSVATLRQVFGFENLILAGSHGLEIGFPGQPPIGPAPDPALDAIEAQLIRFIADKPGLLVERKSISIGLHYRGAPAYQDACDALGAELAARAGLGVQHGHMLVEIRPDGATKGTAIAQLMDLAPMYGARPVMIGDDLTDEYGFAVARDLGGGGILVGALRKTSAFWHLEQVADVRHYLAGSLAHVRGQVFNSIT